jgi:hypothetical protein
MNKLLKLAFLIATLTTAAFAQNAPVNASLEAGYTSTYLVDGLSRTKATPFAGVSLGSTYYGIDVGVSGTVLPVNESLDESHWAFNVGKGFKLFEGVVLRADGSVIRHQAGEPNIPNSTEGNAKLSLSNIVFTPYVKGIYDINLEQYGYAVGIERPTSVFGWFTINPAVEYIKLSDSKNYIAKLGISRTLFGHLTVFAEGNYVKNDFAVSNFNFAREELDGEFVGSGGLRWTF